jgi:hypothetical protein
MATLNLKKIGSLIKVEYTGSADKYIHPSTAVINFIEPKNGTSDIFIQIGGINYYLSAITDIQIDGTPVTDQADFETKIATVFPNAGQSATTTADDIEITDYTKGIIQRSQLGNRFRTTIFEDGDGVGIPQTTKL